MHTTDEAAFEANEDWVDEEAMIWRETRRYAMAEPSLEPISFDEFKRILADVLLIEEEKITPEASFFTDLFVDSLRLVEIVLSIEHLGAEIPSELFWELQTVGDAYECYVNHSAARA